MEAKTTLFLFITLVNFNSEFTLAVHNTIAEVFNMIMIECQPWGIAQQCFFSHRLVREHRARHQRRQAESQPGSKAPWDSYFIWLSLFYGNSHSSACTAPIARVPQSTGSSINGRLGLFNLQNRGAQNCVQSLCPKMKVYIVCKILNKLLQFCLCFFF